MLLKVHWLSFLALLYFNVDLLLNTTFRKCIARSLPVSSTVCTKDQ